MGEGIHASAPPPLPLADEASSARLTRALSSSLPVWGFFGRFLLVVLGFLLIVPSPWTATSFYRGLFERIVLPDGHT